MNVAIIVAFLTGFLTGVASSLILDLLKQGNEMKQLKNKLTFYNGQINK